jgi:ABC-type multidrug transport system permease subunit
MKMKQYLILLLVLFFALLQGAFLSGVAFLSQLFWSKVFQNFWNFGEALVLGIFAFVLGLILKNFLISWEKIKV